MEEISIKDKRKFTRFLPPLLKAQLLFEEEKKDGRNASSLISVVMG